MEKYAELLAKAKKSYTCWDYQQVMKAIRADNALENQEFIKDVFIESIPTILTNDQKKSTKALAKELLTDKALLKFVNEKIKNAPDI